MNRRVFVKTSAGAAAVAGVLNAATQSQQEAASSKAREYYELRQYHVQSGRQQKLTDAFLKDAFVPALNRLWNCLGWRFQLNHRSGDPHPLCLDGGSFRGDLGDGGSPVGPGR